MGGKNPAIPNGDNTWSASGKHSGAGPGLNDMRCYNMTTIRQGPNPSGGRIGWQRQTRCNTPLASAHPSGVMANFADGSVHFLSDSINLETLKNLADCNDGIPVSAF